jgi:hypothetical protein
MSRNTMDTDVIDKNKYADWLKAEMDIIDRYHNHKETMAWTATAFYLPAVFGLAYAANHNGLALRGQLAYNAVAVVMTVSVLSFLNMRFKMRWKAADITVGLRRAMARVCAGTMPQSQSDMEVDYEHERDLPRFVQTEIDRESKRSETLRTWKWFVKASLCVLTLRSKTVDNRLKTELPSYITVIVATATAIAKVWT